MTNAKSLRPLDTMIVLTEETCLRRRLFSAVEVLFAAVGAKYRMGAVDGGAPADLGVLLRYARGECSRLSRKDFESAAESVAEALDLLRGPERWTLFPTHLRALIHVRRFSTTTSAGRILEAALCRFSLEKGYAVRPRRLLALAGGDEREVLRLAGDDRHVPNEAARGWLEERGIAIRAPRPSGVSRRRLLAAGAVQP